jgi:FKBP-type peptidyl-prolyl cis-trans isomerase
LDAYKTTATGLKLYDVVIGDGQEAKAGDRVVLHYDAKWKGLTVSSSRVGPGVTGGTPYGFDLGTPAGKPGGPFIEGVSQGVAGMRVGGQRKLIVPPELAYGPLTVQEIPPNATLTIDLELLSIKQPLPFSGK